MEEKVYSTKKHLLFESLKRLEETLDIDTMQFETSYT